MSNISITLNADLEKKITMIAQKSGRSFEDCVALALSEYAENFENFYKTDLCAVNNLERSFFLSIGE